MKVKVESETEASSWNEWDEQAELEHYRGSNQDQGVKDEWNDQNEKVKSENISKEEKQEFRDADAAGTQDPKGEMTDHIEQLHTLLLNTMVNDAVKQAHATPSVPDGLQTKATPPLAKAMPPMPKTPCTVAEPPASCMPPWQQAPLPPPAVPPPKSQPVPEPKRPPMCKQQLPIEPSVVHQQVQRATGKAGKQYEGYYYAPCLCKRIHNCTFGAVFFPLHVKIFCCSGMV